MYLHTTEISQDEWNVIGISRDGLTLYLWSLMPSSLALSEANPQVTCGKLLGTHAMKPENAVTCAADATRLFIGTNYPMITITGGVDGVIRFWKVKSTEDPWEEVGAFKLYSTAVKRIRCGGFGSLAATSVGPSPELQIIQLEKAIGDMTESAPAAPVKTSFRLFSASSFMMPSDSSSANKVEWQCSAKIEQVIQFSDREKDICFDFLSMHDGNCVLVVSSEKSLRIFHQTSITGFATFGNGWKAVPVEQYPQHAITACGWTPGGSLVCGSQNELYVYSKWTEGYHPASSIPNPDPTIFHEFSHLQQPLPFYHPKILTQYLVSQEFDKVASILKHVTSVLQNNSNVKYIPPIALSDLATGPTLLPPKSEVSAPATSSSDQYSFLDSSNKYSFLDSSSSFASSNSNDKYSFLDSTADKYSFLDSSSSFMDPKSEEPVKEDEPAVTTNNNNNANIQEDKEIFSKEEAAELSELLTSCQLPSVSGTEQLHLLALIDTFGKLRDIRKAIDPSGVRFLLAYNTYAFLRRSLSATDRPASLSSGDFAWALQSEAEDTLLERTLPPNPTWESAKALGVGYWVKNPLTLKTLVEKMAKFQFTAKKDPNDCALFYIMLDKKAALMALFKASKNDGVANFLKNDFNQVHITQLNSHNETGEVADWCSQECLRSDGKAEV